MKDCHRHRCRWRTLALNAAQKNATWLLGHAGWQFSRSEGVFTTLAYCLVNPGRVADRKLRKIGYRMGSRRDFTGSHTINANRIPTRNMLDCLFWPGAARSGSGILIQANSGQPLLQMSLYGGRGSILGSTQPLYVWWYPSQPIFSLTPPMETISTFKRCCRNVCVRIKRR